MRSSAAQLRETFAAQRRGRRKIFTTKDTKSTKVEFDDLSNRVIGCAIEVHRQLGPGPLESAYEQCLAHELRRNGNKFQLQHPQPAQYKDIRLDCGYRIDILVENELILELKRVEEIKGIHEAELLTYMKLAGVKIGLLINFNNTKLKDGIKRFVLWLLRALRVLRGSYMRWDPIVGFDSVSYPAMAVRNLVDQPLRQ